MGTARPQLLKQHHGVVSEVEAVPMESSRHERRFISNILANYLF